MKKRNAIYINCWTDPWIKVAHKLEDDCGIHPVCWIGYSSFTDGDDADISVPREFPGIMYIDNLDAWMAHYPQEVLDKYQDYYLDIDFLNRHANHELQAIKMMERVDPDRYSFNFMERQRHFRNMIKQWMAIIDILKPDCVISTAIPHRLYDYVLYWLCQDKGIDYVMFNHTQFPGRFSCMKNNFYTYGDVFLEDWYNFEKQSDIQKFLPVDMLERFNKVHGDYLTAAPSYMRTKNNIVHFDSTAKTLWLYLKRTLQGKYTIKTLFYSGHFKDVWHYYFCKKKNMKYEESHYSVLQQMCQYIKSNNYKRNLLSYYESLCNKPDHDAPYVCHFLHYQPEATTCPGGDLFVDQRLCIELLLKNLPSSYYVYVKEHKHQFLYNRPGQACRMKDFYDDLIKNPRVKLMSTDEDTFELIKSSNAVSTITGTVGWEAIVRQKPVITFGLTWYENYAKGVLRITDETSAKKIHHFIDTYQYDEHSLFAYLASVGKNSILAYLFKNSAKNVLNITEDECVNNIVSSIEDQIK